MKPPTPGKLMKVNTLLTPELKAWLNSGAVASGRRFSKELEAQLEWARSFEQRMKGPRVLNFLQHLAELTPNGDDWLDDYDAYLEVTAIWREALANRTPPLKIDVQEQIAAGYRLAAELATTPAAFARRRTHLQSMLEVMSRSPGYPEAVREDFARAAATTEPPPEVDQAASPPTPAFVHPFWASWSIARVAVMGSSSGPETNVDLQAIAEHFEQRADLAFLAGMPTRPTAKQLLEYRVLLLEHDLGPPAAQPNAGAATPPVRARSSRSRKRSEASDRQV